MQFPDLLDRFLAEFFRLYPVEATEIGNHDHDGEWPDLTDAGRQERLAFLEDAQRRLDELGSGALSRDEAIDRELLLDEVRARRFEVALQSGVPVQPLREWSESARSRGSGIARLVEPDRELVAGVVVDTDLGPWAVVETPGHAPSHVCLHQPDRGLLLSGDHLLGRVTLYFDFGYTPDPAGEFLDSLDKVDRLGARLCLAGHGRPFREVGAKIEANRRLVRDRLELVRSALRDGPVTPYQIVPPLVGSDDLTPMLTNWGLSQALSYLRHLELRDEARRLPEQDPERWQAA